MPSRCGPWGGGCGGGDLPPAHVSDGCFSVTSGILPSLGARSSNRRLQLRRFIVSPYDPRYRLWEHSLVVLVVYSAWVSPFEFGFLQNPDGVLAVADNAVDAFFAVDIALTFFVAYADKKTHLLQDDPRKIAWRYATSWLALDVASTVPTELSRRILPPEIRSYGFFGMLRLWRLRRVGALFAQYVSDHSLLNLSTLLKSFYRIS